MSGYPNTEGVAEIFVLITQSVALEEEISIWRKTIHEAEVRLKVAEGEYLVTTRSIIFKMETMDVVSHGNFGWERRFVKFISEFYRQGQKLSQCTLLL